jgi:hypothetical protein
MKLRFIQQNKRYKILQQSTDNFECDTDFFFTNVAKLFTAHVDEEIDDFWDYAG